jgi:UDP-galactopyranose mutase
MQTKYDYLIIGSGLFGSVFAHEMKKNGKKCLVLEKRKNIGGNCYTENKNGIDIHQYGAHIFHTDDRRIWDYVNSLVEFNSYKHSVKVNYLDKIYSFPINLMTLYQLWGVSSPLQAEKKIKSSIIQKDDINNLEDWALSQVGSEIYEIFIKGYTEKQWNKKACDLPSSIIKRIPIRMNFDDNYYFDNFQGIPKEGYTKLFEKLLEGIEVVLEADYFSKREYIGKKCR